MRNNHDIKRITYKYYKPHYNIRCSYINLLKSDTKIINIPRISTLNIKKNNINMKLLDNKRFAYMRLYEQKTSSGGLITSEVINQGEILKAENIICNYLAKFSNIVRGILTYIDETTADYLLQIPSNVPIHILTSVIKNDQKIKTKLSIRKIKIYKIERYDNNSNQWKPYFHERWIADVNYLIDIGTDLKKSALGHKQHTISIFTTQSHKVRIDQFDYLFNKSDVELSLSFNKNIRKTPII